jgi:sulfatase modifying factor 1
MVAANKTLGTEAFCIAKYEMKKSGSKFISAPSSKPFMANKATAEAACSNIDKNYRLPTNAEWNAAALEIYENAANWTGGKKSSGTLYTGYFSTWSEPIAISNTKNPYDGTGKTSGIERRTFVLASGKCIWDFGGNAWEWVSDTIYGSSYKPDLSSHYGRNYHNNQWDVSAGSQALYDFTGMASVPKENVYLGQLFGGSTGKVLRGGASSVNAKGSVGIFTANIGDITANELTAPSSWGINLSNVGFRCVTKPQ